MSNRDKLSATPVKALKKVAETENSVISSGSGNFLKIDEGSNKFRLFPRLPGDESYRKMRCVRWITLIGDDGKERRATVLDGKMHGGAKKDIIEAYIDFCNEQLDSTDPQEKAKKALLTAYEGGMTISTSWICYAKKMQGETHTFGLLEVKKTVRDQMDQNTFVEDEDEAIELDPFTDPDDGVPITIKYEKKKYALTLGKKPSPLTDEEIDQYIEKKPLCELPLFTYDYDEFEKAVEGIRYFDEKHEIGLFETQEFQAIVKASAKQFKTSTATTETKSSKPKFVKDEEDDDDDVPVVTKKKKPVVVEEEEEDEEPVVIKKKKPVVVEEEEEEDEAPVIVKKKKPVVVEEEEEEDEPVIIKKKKPVVVEEEEDDEEPVIIKKKKPVVVEEEEEEDDEPVQKKSYGKDVEDTKQKIRDKLRAK